MMMIIIYISGAADDNCKDKYNDNDDFNDDNEDDPKNLNIKILGKKSGKQHRNKKGFTDSSWRKQYNNK